jgi:hypothetical protein
MRAVTVADDHAWSSWNAPRRMPAQGRRYAGQVVVDERMLFLLPDSVDDRAGTLVEPLAVAIRAVDLARVALDEPVLVLGAGPIGLLTALALRRRGCPDATGREPCVRLRLRGDTDRGAAGRADAPPARAAAARRTVFDPA